MRDQLPILDELAGLDRRGLAEWLRHAPIEQVIVNRVSISDRVLALGLPAAHEYFLTVCVWAARVRGESWFDDMAGWKRVFRKMEQAMIDEAANAG